MKRDKKPRGYWNNKENVFEEAKKYKTKSEFQEYCSRAYEVARKNGWLDEMTWFIDGRVKLFTDKNDSVYKYYWEETNSIYIGRTLMHRQKIRHNVHITSEKDTVFRYAKENGLTVPPMEIIEDNLTIKEGLDREDYWVNYYKKKGYNVLNTAKTGIGSGSLGAISYGKWTKEKVFEEAKKYKSKSEFQKGCSRAYTIALKSGWFNEMDWFKNSKKPNGYWTKEKVFEEARKYSTRKEFSKGCNSAYVIARKSGWLNEMDWLYFNKRRPKDFWIKINVEKEARKYNTRKEFSKGCATAYQVARKNKWLDELFPKYKIAS